MTYRTLALLPTLALLTCSPLVATETENFGLRVLPAGGPMTIDGDPGEWDLSGGIFGCGDVENLRDKFAFWAHAAYDADNLYVLIRFVDPTPMNNPGQVEGSYGWDGDSLQFRMIVGDGVAARPETGRASHWTCWSGRNGKTVMDVAYGLKFDQGGLKDAQTKGAKQMFKVLPDQSGYVQELSIPWSLIAPDGWKPSAGESFRLTFEPNYTVGTSGRLSAKDLFASNTQIDRVFTFMSSQTWGNATFAKSGKVTPAPVRLSDRREFKVALHGGVPQIDWTDLIKQKTLTGHKTISFDMPFDGYISLNIFAADGSVARQLLTTAFYTKGKHEVKWDGLTTFSWRDPGEPVPAGTYTWQALVHPGLDLKLVGWAGNSGSAPWDGPTGKDNWGGDEGLPRSAASVGDKTLLGWSGAEAGKALVMVDAAGNVQWKHSRQGMSGCRSVAADGRYVYGVNYGEHDTSYAYRLDLATGSYAAWPGKDTPDLFLHALLDDTQKKTITDRIDAIAVRDGQLILANTAGNAVVVCDGTTGALKKIITVPAPVALAAMGGGLVYVSSTDHGVQVLDTASGQLKPFITVPAEIGGLTTDAQGNLFVAVRGTQQQVLVFDKAGKQVRTIGRAGGRPLVGPWDATGMRNPSGISIDSTGQLWVTEEIDNPKRISVWNTSTGAFVRELFGPTAYGALGGSISPKDPLVMAGMGSEWRLDAKNGKAACMGVIDADGFSNSRFAVGSNGREYLITAQNWAFEQSPLKIYEHVSAGVWKLRSMVIYRDKAGKDIVQGHPAEAKVEAESTTTLWADRNGNGMQEADEFFPSISGIVMFSGWYMGAAPELSLYANGKQFRTTGFTACGAPTWNLAKPTQMPAIGMGSADGTMVLAGGNYGEAHTQYQCFDIATGKRRWTYPDTFVGVHGSHNAPPPEAGLIRGAYSSGSVSACAVVKLPDPIGNTWVISTNVGEWHLLTEKGFYLSRLFQPDQIKVSFPEKAVPGVLLNDAPCGMGGEDFGGSATLATDGKLYLQAGKTGFWNVAVEHLDQVKQLQGVEPISIATADLPLAQRFREQAQQAVVGVQRLVVKRATAAPTFTGDIAKDFASASLAAYDKGEGAHARTAMLWDDTHLYLAWEVQDRSPWTNGARSGDALYWSGDTVDFQLGTNPAAAVDREEAVQGDLRLSIGSLAGKDTAVVFRKVAEHKQPKTFTSGVIKDYVMDSVLTLDAAAITVTRHADSYTVEAVIPLHDLGFTAHTDLKLKGDFGVTFGNQAGDRTRLRSYWSNQHVGIVDDVVFELKMEPKYWGELSFE